MKSKYTVVRLMTIVFVAVVCLSYADAKGAVLEDYEVNGIHYKISQEWEAPMWVEVVATPDHQKITSLDFPEELLIKGYSRVEECREAIFERIGEKAFEGARFTTAIIPASVRRIGAYAFASVPLKSIVLQEGLEYIGAYTFAGTKLNDVTIPESVKVIDYSAFSNTYSLTDIHLPSTLVKLGGFVFHYCSDLRDIYCKASVPPTCSDTDFGIIHYLYYPIEECALGPDCEKCVLHVPEESIELYRNAPGVVQLRQYRGPRGRDGRRRGHGG